MARLKIIMKTRKPIHHKDGIEGGSLADNILQAKEGDTSRVTVIESYNQIFLYLLIAFIVWLKILVNCIPTDILGFNRQDYNDDDPPYAESHRAPSEMDLYFKKDVWVGILDNKVELNKVDE